MNNEKYNYFCMYTPEGKVAPIESVHRSTEHGSICVGVRNATTGIIIAQKTGKNDKFTDGKTKIKQLANHLIYTYSGITNDEVQFGEAIKNKLQDERHRTGTAPPLRLLIEEYQFDSSIEVMRYGRRATGVSVLLMGVENNQIELLELSPTGEAIPCYGACIGARAQSARTILESHPGNISSLSDDDLLHLAFTAFKNAINDQDVLDKHHFDICKISPNGISFLRAPEASTPE